MEENKQDSQIEENGDTEVAQTEEQKKDSALLSSIKAKGQHSVQNLIKSHCYHSTTMHMHQRISVQRELKYLKGTD